MHPSPDPSRDATQVSSHVGAEAAQHVTVTQAQVLGKVSALAASVAPVQGYVVPAAAPGAVIDDRVGQPEDPIAGLEQAKAQVVVLGARELRAGSQPFVEQPDLIEGRAA